MAVDKTKNNITLKEQLENFLNSDKGSAQATKLVLAAIALAGAVFVAAAVPGTLQAFGSYKRGRKYTKRQLGSAFYALKKRGFVEELEDKEGIKKVRLTKKGKETIRKFSIENLSIAKPKRWDRKWRVLIFDIPNQYNRARDVLREKTKELGFYQLQKSTWIYPYPCEDEILFIAHCFDVEHFIEVLTVESLLCKEDEVKKHFDL